MTKIKLCGLSGMRDIEAANELQPDYIGFVFARKSRRYLPPEAATELKRRLDPRIQAVGVFVNERPELVAGLLRAGVIDLAQLHGNETEEYIERLRTMTDKPIVRAFRVDTQRDIARAAVCSAELVLLDSGGGGTGTAFDWGLAQNLHRPYFLAGGLDADNVGAAVRTLRPYAVDVSSGVETDGRKDRTKMAAFVAAVRKEDGT